MDAITTGRASGESFYVQGFWASIYAGIPHFVRVESSTLKQLLSVIINDMNRFSINFI